MPAATSAERTVVQAVTPARVALAGNPSDGYGGSVVGLPVRSLHATVEMIDEPVPHVARADADLRALITAAARVFAHHVGATESGVAERLRVATNIPRSVGLAGSSAVIISALRVLASHRGAMLAPPVLAALAQRAEVDVLGVPAGLQDRVVQAFDDAVLMEFGPGVMDRVEGLPTGRYRLLRTVSPLPAFVAWRVAGAESSAVVHTDLGARHRRGDPVMARVIPELARQAERAATAFEEARWDDLGRSMDRTLDLRGEMVALRPEHHALVDAARRMGAPVNYAGSGGSIVGLHHRCGLDAVTAALDAIGATVRPVSFP